MMLSVKSFICYHEIILSDSFINIAMKQNLWTLFSPQPAHVHLLLVWAIQYTRSRESMARLSYG